MKPTFLRTLGLLVLLLALLPRSGAAQEVSLDVEPLFRGWFREDAWLPIMVHLTNAGAAADVEVVVDEPVFYPGPRTRYHLVTQLPGPSRRRYQLLVRSHPRFPAASYTVRLLYNGREIARRTVNSQPLDEDALVVMIAPEPGGLGTLAEMPLPPRPGVPPGLARVAYVRPEDAPERWAGYDAVDLVVLGNLTGESLSAAQQRALRQWVQTGGTLVVSGGPDRTRLRNPFFESLLPTGGEAAGGSTGGGPFLASGRLGLGLVVFLADDPTRPALDRGGVTTALWQQLLSTALQARKPSGLVSQERPQDGPFSSGSPLGSAPNPPESRFSALGHVCYEISQLDLPPAETVALFLLTYLVCLVPVNYAILKRRDRKEWAWVTTPAIVFFFSLFAYGVGRGTKGGQVVLARPGIIEARAGSPVGRAESYLGLFSPRKTRYDLAVASPEAVLSPWQPWAQREEGDLRLMQAETWRIDDLEVGMWSMRILRVELPVALGDGITARWGFSPTPNRLFYGTVTNGTPWDLDDCRLLYGDGWVELGRLPRGATVNLEARRLPQGSNPSAWQSMAERISGEDTRARMERALLQSLRDESSPRTLLVGWVREPLFPVTVDGRRAREENVNLLVAYLPP